MELNAALVRKVLDTVDAGLVSGLGSPQPGQMCVEAAVCYAMGLPHSDDPGCVAPSLRALKISLNDRDWSSPQARAKGLRRLAVIQLGTKGTLNEGEFVRRLVEMTIRKLLPKVLRAVSARFTGDHAATLIEAAARCETEGTQAAADAAADAAHGVAYAADAAYAANAAAYAAYAANAAAQAAHAANAAAQAAHGVAYAAHGVAYAAYATHATHAADAAACAAADAAVYAAYAADAATFDAALGEFAEGVVEILVEMKAPAAPLLALAVS